jgi:hypothetical protein
MADIRKLIQTGANRDTMRTAFPILNMVIDSANESLNTANEAKTDADNAVQTANLANTKSDDTQQQLNNIVINNGESDAEVLQARGSYSVLNERLEAADMQLAEKVSQEELTQEVNIIDIEYGLIELPTDFPHSLPFDVTVIDENTIEHKFDIETYKVGAGRVYLDWWTGADTNDGLTPATPVKTLLKSLQLAEAQAESSIVIHIMNKYFTRNYSTTMPTDYSLTKNIIFSPYGMERTFLGPFENTNSLTWTEDGLAHKTNRSAVTNVLDLAFSKHRGEPQKYKKVNSVAEVQAERGTWYSDGSSLWIRRMEDKAPDDDLMIMLNVSKYDFLINDKKLVFDRVSFFWTVSSADADGLRVTGNHANSELVLYRASFAHATANGVAAQKVGKVYNVESLAYDNNYDGFNYHGTMVTNPYEFVYEYYVEALDNGKNGVGNNNGSTAHEGMSVLRIGTLAYRSDGPNIADVNGCYSILYNCVGHTSTKLTDSPTKAGLFFNNSSGVKPGKVLLFNCGGGGKGTYSLSSDGLIEIHARRFKGKNIYPNTLPTIQFY